MQALEERMCPNSRSKLFPSEASDFTEKELHELRQRAINCGYAGFHDSTDYDAMLRAVEACSGGQRARRSATQKALDRMLLPRIYTATGKERECERERIILVNQAQLAGFTHGFFDIVKIKSQIPSLIPGPGKADWDRLIDKERERKETYLKRLEAYLQNCHEFL